MVLSMVDVLVWQLASRQSTSIANHLKTRYSLSETPVSVERAKIQIHLGKSGLTTQDPKMSLDALSSGTMCVSGSNADEVHSVGAANPCHNHSHSASAQLHECAADLARLDRKGVSSQRAADGQTPRE